MEEAKEEMNGDGNEKDEEERRTRKRRRNYMNPLL